ncbi:1,4-alpha-glucan branching protein [Kitasatospora sp. NPDC101801]|uniref:maltokinase N-terminal cap-like domain-containing protein n=1 Tax=Kitasatospora sp. NPDC101801 TaxID=3364103 RepID=UPI003829348B
MAVVHRTTMKPGKLELLTEWLPQQSWYLGAGRAPELVRAGGFRLDDPEGEVGIEFMVVVDTAGPDPVAYLVPLAYRGAPNGTGPTLIGTSEHGVLGTRWIYHGTGDPVLMTELAALLSGNAVPQQQSESDTPDPTVTVHPVTTGEPFSYETVEVLRPLADQAAELPGDAVLGQVVAGWRWPDGTPARAVFARATR